MSSIPSQNKSPTKYDLLGIFITKFGAFIDGLSLRVPNTSEFQDLVSQFRFLATKAPEELVVFSETEILPYQDNLAGLVQAKAKKLGTPLEQVAAEDVAKLIAYLSALCKIIIA